MARAEMQQPVPYTEPEPVLAGSEEEDTMAAVLPTFEKPIPGRVQASKDPPPPGHCFSLLP